MKRWVVAFLAVAVMVGAGCSSDEERRLNRQERRQFYVVMESKLRQIDRGMVQLGDVASHADSAYASDVERLKDNGRTLRGKLDTMNTASNEEWPALRDSLEHDYHGVRLQYADLKDRATRYYAPAIHDSATATTSSSMGRGGTN
jgi:hypothetical protein